MDFRFGSARELYEQRIHPRVMVGLGDLPILRERIASGPGQKVFEALRRRAGAVAQVIEQIPDLRATMERWGEGWTNAAAAIIWGMHDLAMVGVLDEDERLMDAAGRVLMALPDVYPPRDPATVRDRRLVQQIYGMIFGLYPLAYDLLHSRFTPEQRRRFSQWVIQAAVRPAIDIWGATLLPRAGANIPICYSIPALIGLMAVMGDEGADNVRAETDALVRCLDAVAHAALGPDGYPEEDIGYGTAVLAGVAQVAEPARRAGLYDIYAACSRYARFGQAMLQFVQPWGENLSNTGDHGDDFGWRELILARQAEETGNPALLWLLGTLSYGHRGETGQETAIGEVELSPGIQMPKSAVSLLVVHAMKRAQPPSVTHAPTHFRDRARGIVSFRSGWKADDALLIFDGGQRSPAGQGHAHDSSGHFSLSALGEYFAIDTGRYNIEQNCHNVTLVNGKSGRSTDGEWRMSYYYGRLIDYRPGAFCDYAAADSSHQHNCYWAWRHVGLVKGRSATPYAWTVDDINAANDWAEFWWQLHTSPENVIAIDGVRATIRGWRQGNLLDVHFALLPGGQFPKPHTLALEQDIACPSSYRYIPNPEERMKGLPRPAEALHGPCYVRPRLWAKVAGYNGRFMSLMVPRREDEPAPEVAQVQAPDNVLAMKVTFAEVEDLLIFAYDHSLLEAADVVGRGQACVVRRSREDGRLLHHELINGEKLEVAGRRVV